LVDLANPVNLSLFNCLGILNISSAAPNNYHTLPNRFTFGGLSIRLLG
jgi:hypothetical protein